MPDLTSLPPAELRAKLDEIERIFCGAHSQPLPRLHDSLMVSLVALVRKLLDERDKLHEAALAVSQTFPNHLSEPSEDEAIGRLREALRETAPAGKAVTHGG